jgi:hypothetical protein
VPVRIDVTLSRYLGDKRVSNLPFTLLTLANGSVSLRVGSQVPVPQNPLNSNVVTYTYQNVGTNIDAVTSPLGSDRFSLELRLNDTSVTEPPAPSAAEPTRTMPILRTHVLSTRLILRDGQTTELVVAADKVTGETIKAEVRVTVVK